MIGRIPRRVGFAPFRGSRAVRDGMMSLRMVVDPDATGVRVAFSTPKRIGTAVTRNRLRRQLRELMRARAPRLPHGWYFLSVERDAVDKSWGQLGSSVDELLARATPSAIRPQKPNKINHMESL